MKQFTGPLVQVEWKLHEGISAKAKGDEATVSWLPLVPLLTDPAEAGRLIEAD